MWLVAEITELWEAELLDSLILINVVPGISVVMQSLDIFNKRGGRNNSFGWKILRKLIAVTSRLFGREE